MNTKEDIKKWIFNYLILKNHQVIDHKDGFLIDNEFVKISISFLDINKIGIIDINDKPGCEIKLDKINNVDVNEIYILIQRAIKNVKNFTALLPNLNVCLLCEHCTSNATDINDFTNDKIFSELIFNCGKINDLENYIDNDDKIFYSLPDLNKIYENPIFRVPINCPSKLEHTVVKENKIKNIRKILMDHFIKNKAKINFNTFVKIYNRFDKINANSNAYIILFDMLKRYEEITSELDVLNTTEGCIEE